MTTAVTPPRERPSSAQRAYAERTLRTLRRRHAVNVVMVGMTFAAAVVATLPLLFILFYLVSRGASSLSLDFFTNLPAPLGMEGGGMGHAMVGTLVLIGIASAIGLPIGIGAGLYLAERGAHPLATTVRFLSDVLNGLPSIVMGIFAWQFVVRPMGDFSALAGGFALGAMMIPLVTRTTEEMVRVVPVSLREAALALGYTRWRTSLTIVLRTAMAGIVTGVLVAVARIAGETAPLLFTALGSSYWPTSLTEGGIASLPHQIYVYATGPYDEWKRQAFAASLVLLGLILVISLIARYATRGRFTGAGD